MGYGAIGIWRYKLNEYGECKAVELLEEVGMSVSSLHWAGGFTGTDGRTYRESLLDGLEAIELAAELKANCLVILTGSRGIHTRSHCRRLVSDAIRELAEAAFAHNLKLAIEPMHAGCAGDCTFINDLPLALDFIADLNLPNVGLVFDAYHLGHDTKTLEWLPSIVESVSLVQLGDAQRAPFGEQNRCQLGAGHLPLSQIVELLERSGYDGYYELELTGEDVEHVDYEQLLKKSANVVANWIT